MRRVPPPSRGGRDTISIHAPTWGATVLLSQPPQTEKFQSTHPRGVRLSGHWRQLQLRDFNPRTHVGCDDEVLEGTDPLGLFQSTHPRGVRRSVRSGHNSNCKISIHAPTWGATVSALSLRQRNWISIHAPTWGATTTYHRQTPALGISIHAPTWGATVKPSNGWLLGHKDNEFANENIIIINSVNIT